MNKHSVKPHIALFIANLFFGLNYSYSKDIIPEYLRPESLSILRVVVVSVLFGSILAIAKKWKVDRKDIPKLILAGFLGVVCNQLVFLKGLSMTSPIDAAIIGTLGPILVLVLSSVFYKERVTALKLTGIIIGGIGAMVVIVGNGSLNTSSSSFLGNLLVFISASCYAFYLVWSKPLLVKYEPITVMGWIFFVGAVIMLPTIGSSLTSIDFAAIPSKIYFALAFVLLCSTFLAYLLIATSLKRVRPTTVSIYGYAQPIIASFFAIFRGQDKLTFLNIISALLVFLGVFIVTQSYRFEKK